MKLLRHGDHAIPMRSQTGYPLVPCTVPIPKTYRRRSLPILCLYGHDTL